jgi:acylphosphatase
VQGVGFRATAQRIAQRFAVCGYVRNLPDRSVELVVEGRSGEVQRFLDAVALAMRHGIEQVATQPLAPGAPMRGFAIRH